MPPTTDDRHDRATLQAFASACRNYFDLFTAAEHAEQIRFMYELFCSHPQTDDIGYQRRGEMAYSILRLLTFLERCEEIFDTIEGEAQ